MLPSSITDSIWRYRLLAFGVQSCRALGMRMMCASLQPAGLGWGNLLGSKAQQVSQTFRGYKNNNIFWLFRRGFSCNGSEGLVDDESLNPTLCPLGVTLP